MKNTYSPREFGALIGRTTKTLQRWDRESVLKAHRSVTNRRYYLHSQYLELIGQKTKDRKNIVYCRVSSASDLVYRHVLKSVSCLPFRLSATRASRAWD